MSEFWKTFLIALVLFLCFCGLAVAMALWPIIIRYTIVIGCGIGTFLFIFGVVSLFRGNDIEE